jgi:PhnB protein
MPDRPLSEQLDQAIDSLLAGTRQHGSPDQTLAALMKIADRLRDMPDDGFKTRLSRELQTAFRRRTPMTVSTTIEPAAGEFAAIHTITPFICVPDGARLVEFMKATFAAEETSRHPHHGPDGFVANVRIGDSDLLIMGGESMRGQESRAALHVYVKDCDATYKRALDAGAVTAGGLGEPADRPYGERAAFVSDPFGNYWFIATRFGASYSDAGLRHVTPCLLPSQAAPLIEFLKGAFGAKLEGPPHLEGGRLMHAFVRIGEAMIEMAEAQEEGLRPFAHYLHTDDVDAVYHRAVAAGATSFLAPADQPFGDRLAIVVDPLGNRWFAAKRIVPV